MKYRINIYIIREKILMLFGYIINMIKLMYSLRNVDLDITR